MLFSHSAAYAVRALVWLARQPKDSRWLATEVARMEGIPQPYLSKVLGALKSQGIVDSIRGPKGGYVLALDPSSISLLKVAEVFDTDKRLNSCLLAYGECGACAQCPIGDLWKGTRDSVRLFMETTTIGALAQRGQSLTPKRKS